MEFEFKDVDKEGLENLEAITEADRFNAWMYDTIKPHCEGKILEVGSGIGNISQFFVRDQADIHLSDIRDNYLLALGDRFPDTNQTKLDLVHPHFEALYSEHLDQYDTVFALNVVEHIKDDVLTMKNIKKLLKPQGKVIILVPAFQRLYNVLDKELYHYRRYTPKTLQNIFRKSDITILKTHYFNAMGIPAWFIAGKLAGDKTIKKGKMNFYNAMVPVFKLFDYPMKQIAGLSVVCIGEK